MTHWMTTAEIAQHLRVSRWTVYQWTNRADDPMPRSIAGRLNRYDRDEVDSWLRRHKYNETMRRHRMTA